MVSRQTVASDGSSTPGGYKKKSIHHQISDKHLYVYLSPEREVWLKFGTNLYLNHLDQMLLLMDAHSSESDIWLKWRQFRE